MEFEAAVQVHPNHAVLRNNLATALFIGDRLREAVVHYQAATALDPEYFNSWFNLGRVLGVLGQSEEARAALDVAGRLRPGSAEVSAARTELGGD